ncbi:hypothetical protein CEUSTIGMA_g383.t1 [Chlamydomonas eustigma]|uniref:RRM domain-containing protein n=1 Tax=Chlamydomonas eustigma TaxID=1157962 RepID=A0A250WQ24_9CHLO|nr:hypothetical protein CEUSTIGMA_g383.t1 [Chlamydomonas eustigma]|eukprot:GAX72928.1 hypothetical protein CEUSTIGMA_g383.t1 [Chlamydomonas eustigma]
MNRRDMDSYGQGGQSFSHFNAGYMQQQHQQRRTYDHGPAMGVPAMIPPMMYPPYGYIGMNSYQPMPMMPGSMELGHMGPSDVDMLTNRMGGMRLQHEQNLNMEVGYGRGNSFRSQQYSPMMEQTSALSGGSNSKGRQGHNQNSAKRRNQRGLEDKTQRTVYISSIDLKVTEAQLASFFMDCGEVLDCRICGDPNSATRFAFIEFTEVEGAERALDRTGIMLGSLPLRILPSKTAIVPVKRELMPSSQDDVERCGRTVYVTNIDKRVDRVDVRGFFEQLCGKVCKLRLLGDSAHSTRIAFVEFVGAEAAMAALNCSGAILGSLPIRVSPSKTPVRSEHTGSSSNNTPHNQNSRSGPIQPPQHQRQDSLPNPVSPPQEPPVNTRTLSAETESSSPDSVDDQGGDVEEA